MTIKMKRTLKSDETKRLNFGCDKCDISTHAIGVKNKLQVFEKLQLYETIQEKNNKQNGEGQPQKMDKHERSTNRDSREHSSND